MRTLYLLCACALAMPSFAQEPPRRQGQPQGQGGQGMQRQMQPYDASKEETLKVKVKDVSEQARGPMTTVVLTVTVDGKDYQVMLGPADFLKEKKAGYAKDDEITIKGVKGESPRGGGLMIRAREITKGENTLVLLNKEGQPVWRPQGQPGGSGGPPQQGGRPGGPPPQR